MFLLCIAIINTDLIFCHSILFVFKMNLSRSGHHGVGYLYLRLDPYVNILVLSYFDEVTVIDV